MTVYICPTSDTECGNNQYYWCADCPKRNTKPIKVEVMDVEVGELIKTMRLSKKMTQGQLAKLIGMERTSVTNIEGGKQRLMFDTLQQIANKCDFELVLTIKRMQP